MSSFSVENSIKISTNNMKSAIKKQSNNSFVPIVPKDKLKNI
jgi:hypothetical protein